MSDIAENRTALDVLKEKMVEGIAHFVYIRKSDGVEREAFGTINSELIPKYDPEKVASLIEAAEFGSNYLRNAIDRPSNLTDDPDGYKGGLLLLDKARKPFMPKDVPAKSKEPNLNLVTYYDLESRGWRSFGVENLVRVI